MTMYPQIFTCEYIVIQIKAFKINHIHDKIKKEVSTISIFYFKKRIKCLQCGKNYKGKMERSKTVYVCSGYSNFGKEFCPKRWKLPEQYLLELIHNHFIIDMYKEMKIIGGKGETNPTPQLVIIEELIERVKVIEVNPIEEEVTIHFTDGTKTFMSNNRHAYWIDEK